MQVDLKNSTLEKSEVLYKKALEHLSLTEKVDEKLGGWFDYQINILNFLLTFVALIAAILGFNAFTFNRNLKARIIELREMAQKDIENQTQIIKTELLNNLQEKFKIQEKIILDTFKKEELYQRITAEGKLLVISSKSDLENQPYKELKKATYCNIDLDFANQNFELPSIEINKYDIIIIDNQDVNGHHWDFNEEKTKNNLINFVSIACQNNIAVLYYGDSKMDGGIASIPAWKNNSRTNTFSNSLDTLVPAVNRALTNKYGFDH
ncbi:MAG: hypothetical protein JNK69_13765 [Saprospiraceae bacterium]|nr:hypothetical protein [Saprospiraceae bacterium]